MNWELILFLTAIMLFAYWFVYLTGGPLSENPNDVDTKAILFDIPYNLSARRLRKLGLEKRYWQEFINEIAIIQDPGERIKHRQEFRKNLFLAGREFFTWERSLLCPICLHWWLTVLAGVVCLSFNFFHARADFFLGGFTYLVLHLVNRKIS